MVGVREVRMKYFKTKVLLHSYIVAGLIYFTLFGVCFSLLRQQVKGCGAIDMRPGPGGWNGLTWGVARVAQEG